MKINVFCFRRDLRLGDNIALAFALNSGLPVLPLFIFDTEITEDLQVDDPRINFIYTSLKEIDSSLRKTGSSLLVKTGNPLSIWKEIVDKYDIDTVFTNKDYEPYSINRDAKITTFLNSKSISHKQFKDQVLFEEREIVKSDNEPYTVFTPYKKTWLKKYLYQNGPPEPNTKNSENFLNESNSFPSLNDLGFRQSTIKVRSYDLSIINDYDKFRDIPSEDRTSFLGPHLRFGTVSIRKIMKLAAEINPVFLSELIWREFFMQILFNYPDVVNNNFRKKYDNIIWRNNEKEFEAWCRGETGYQIVDAGMRQLNETGYMHNRVRMIAAGFLCKHLLIDWRWGEAYFAEKLLDYELSSNNGNWQWAAGTGCDAAPYFRIFNPFSQLKKFDPELKYVRKWIKDLDNKSYPEPIIDHNEARTRAISTYKSVLAQQFN